MNHMSGPSDDELHTRLHVLLQADAESETADEDTIRSEVEQLTASLPNGAASQSGRSGRERARWNLPWRVIAEVALLLATGLSLAVSIIEARGSTLVSAIAAATAIAAVLALVYVRTTGDRLTLRRAHTDREYEYRMQILRWEHEDKQQQMLWQRQDKLRELAHARADAREQAALDRSDKIRALEWERDDRREETAYQRAKEELEVNEARQLRKQQIEAELEIMREFNRRGLLDRYYPDLNDMLRRVRGEPVDTPGAGYVEGRAARSELPAAETYDITDDAWDEDGD